jgi:hypothetical protein
MPERVPPTPSRIWGCGLRSFKLRISGDGHKLLTLWYNRRETHTMTLQTGTLPRSLLLERGGIVVRKLFNFMLGFLLGVLVGAAIAMLLAPEAGEQTRQQLQMQKDRVIEEGRRAAAERRAELEAQLEQLKKGKLPGGN